MGQTRHYTYRTDLIGMIQSPLKLMRGNFISSEQTDGSARTFQVTEVDGIDVKLLERSPSTIRVRKL